jgi:hypothetical protein
MVGRSGLMAALNSERPLRRQIKLAARQKATRPFARPFESEFRPHAVAQTERFATGIATELDQFAAKSRKNKRKIGGERGIHIESQDIDLLDFY